MMRRKKFAANASPGRLRIQSASRNVARNPRKTESVAPDSLVFDRIRLRTACRQAPCGKFFCSGQIRHRTRILDGMMMLRAASSCSNPRTKRNRQYAKNAGIYMGFQRAPKFQVLARHDKHARTKRVHAVRRLQSVPGEFGSHVHSLLSGVSVFSVVLV
jgi:hypothetical protein